MVPSEADTILDLHKNIFAKQMCVREGPVKQYMSLCTVFSRTCTYIKQFIAVCSCSTTLEGRDKACGSVLRYAGARQR